MARQFTRRTVGRSQRRESLWVDIATVASTLSATGGTIQTSANAALLALRPFTIIRTHMFYSIRSDQEVQTENQFAAAGAAVVSDQAVAVGVTAVPTPFTDAGSDLWFLHQRLANSVGILTAVGISGQVASHYEVDSKAMRRVEDGSDIVFVVEFDSVGDPSIVVSMGRMLIKTN